MAEILACPDAAHLRNLLDGRLSDEQQTQLDQHLETCPHCQQRLEDLAAGTQTWTAAAQNLLAGLAPPEAGLERIMAESKRLEQDETQTSPVDAALDFLSPPDDPAHLGRLGNYPILSVIGRGGMSVVLKGFDPSLQRVVAIKVLAPQLATNAAARIRFQREGYAAAAISHEHVVAVYAVDEVNGLPYLVMEYIAGESLQERLDRAGPLELKEVLRIGMQTAQGLAAAHAQGLVHRDIKPANILLHNGVARVKITDFGLARAVDDASLTQSGLIAGTPQYMSPEQARGDAIDARTDLFSLGSVLYAMCAGRPPFRASTTMGVLKRVSDESPRAVREVNAEVSPWLAEIIAKLHAKNPEDRFQSAAEVAELLGRHLAQVQQGTPIPAPVLPVSTSPAAPPPRRTAFLGRPDGLGRPSYKRSWAIAATILPVIAGMFVASEATGVTNVTEFMATVLRIKTPDGTLVVETDDPGIEVAVDGGEVTIHGAGPKEIRVRAGDHRIRATKDGKEVPLDQPLVTVTRGGKTIVRIRQENAQGQASAPLSGPADKRQAPKPLSDLADPGGAKPLIDPKDSKPLYDKSNSSGKAAPKRSGPSIITGEKATQQMIRVSVRMENGRPVFRIEDRVVDPSKLGHELRAVLKATAKTQLALTSDDDVLHSAIVAVQDAAKWAGIDRVRLVLPDSSKDTPKHFREIAVLRGHEGVVRALAFAPDGKYLVSVGGGPDGPTTKPVSGELRRWDIAARLDRILQPPRPAQVRDGWSVASPSVVFAAAFSPGGMNLATAEADGTVRLRDADTGQVEAILRGHKGPVYALAYAPDGQTIASAGLDRDIKIWRVSSKRLLESFDSGNTRLVNCLAFSRDDKTLAVGGEDHHPLAGPASADADGNLVKKNIHIACLFDVGSWKARAVLAGHEGPIRQLAFSPDGKLLATAGDDGTVRIWNAADGKQLVMLIPGNAGKIRCLAFSPDGSMLATGGEKPLIVWRFIRRSGSLMGDRVLTGQSKVFSIAFSPDGHTLASGSADGIVKLWSVEYKSLPELHP